MPGRNPIHAHIGNERTENRSARIPRSLLEIVRGGRNIGILPNEVHAQALRQFPNKVVISIRFGSSQVMVNVDGRDVDLELGRNPCQEMQESYGIGAA
ncbi:MAG TPA: hypothetical protein VN670_05980 [Acidobacteriaceae bacterium]|nr:hypothetical protein [Acidobacteriaceae bacterium]